MSHRVKEIVLTSRSASKEDFVKQSRNDDGKFEQLQRHHSETCHKVSAKPGVQYSGVLTTEHDVGNKEITTTWKRSSEKIENFRWSVVRELTEEIPRRGGDLFHSISVGRSGEEKKVCARKRKRS